MTFQRKLQLGFCLMVLPVALIGAEALRSNHEERLALEALGESMKRTRTYAELETAMFNQSEAVWRFLSGMDPRAEADFDLIEKVVQHWQERWEAELRPEEMGLARDVEALHAELRAVSERVFDLDRSGHHEDAYRLAERELKARLLPALTAKNREVYRRARESSVQGAFARLEEILAGERRALFSILALSVAAGMVASLLISRGLARPIRRLQAAMAIVGQGRLEHPIEVRTKDEVGELARAFAGMTESLARSRQALAGLNADLATKVRKLEETQAQLVQSEKLASIGEMSAAVAHGLRNPLASLRAAAQLALHQMKENLTAREHLKTIIAEVDRLDRRISHLLTFSRPVPFRPLEERVSSIIDGLLPTFKARLQEGRVTVLVHLPDDLPEVRVDPMQLEQALVEILSNALDAMPAGGTLEISGRRERDESGAVVLEVSDTGGGIPPSVLPSVCDPFFTTRNEGTGLGLAIAKRYVVQNGGRLEIESEKGAGTTARIFLPAVAEAGEIVAAAETGEMAMDADGRAPRGKAEGSIARGAAAGRTV